MSTVTLEAVKAEHTRIGEMIAELEKATKENFFEFLGRRIAINEGETYVGSIVCPDASRSGHIVALPGVAKDLTWAEAKEWAAGQGGELMDRVEGALAFATSKDLFEPEWYWTREAHASHSGYAWIQFFDRGSQGYFGTTGRCRARAFRRLPLE